MKSMQFNTECQLYEIIEDDGTHIYQPHKYLDDGFYIIEKDGKFTIFEVDSYDNINTEYAVCDDLASAILKAKEIE